MDRYSLIKSLQEKSDKTPLPKGHKYVECTTIVEGDEMIVKIPEKEVEAFKTALNESDEIDKYNFNRIMRIYRGIRG